MQQDSSELYAQNKLSPQLLKALGFQQALQSSLPHHLLHYPSTHNRSCLRDAVLTALQNYNRLQRMLMNANTISNWKFYHVILCSLPDKVSRINRKELLLEIVKLNALWRCGRFRTFFIPIGMGDQDIQEIMNICEVGGEDWVAYPTTFQDFHEQFKSVMAEIGVKTKASLLDSEDSRPAYFQQVETQSKAITLSVEASQMMKGHNWQSIINSISFYMRNLGPKDIVSGIIFNATPWVITSKNLPPQPQPQPIQYQQEVINQYPMQAGMMQPIIQPILQPRPQYQQYVQPLRIACPRKCGVCCTIFTILFIIRLVFYLSLS